jgi:hypothetical protein
MQGFSWFIVDSTIATHFLFAKEPAYLTSTFGTCGKTSTAAPWFTMVLMGAS